MAVPGLFFMLLLLFCQQSSVTAEEDVGQIFTSTYKLTHLLDSEIASVKILRDYITYQRTAIKNMKTAQKSVEETVQNQHDFYQGVDHPVNAYKLINRFVAHWKKVYNTVFNLTVQDTFKRQIMHGLDGFQPQAADFHGSYKSLLRLQITYNLSPKKMVDGLINEHLSDPLDQVDCYNMALTAIAHHLNSEALEWTRLAGDKADSESEMWEIHNDVDEFERRVKSAEDPKVMSEVIQEYLSEAVGYDYEREEDVEEEEEVEYYYPDGTKAPTPDKPSDLPQEEDNQNESIEEEDEMDVSEIADKDFVEGELNVAQYSSEMEQDLAAMDEYEHMKQLRDEELDRLQNNMKDSAEEDDDATIEDTNDSQVPFADALRDAQEHMKVGDIPQQSKCGGDGTPRTRVVRERSIDLSTLGPSGISEGKHMKIRYQGMEIPESQLNEIEDMLSELYEPEDYSRYQSKDRRYFALCRGEEVMRRDLSILKCRYRVMNLPYNVWKEEILSREPMVAMIYNFVKESEMGELKTLSKHHLHRAMAGKSFIEDRIQSSSWHTDDTSSSIYALSKRVSIVTGLDAMESAEAWQVGQYGIGGHYATHFDYNHDRFSKIEIRNKIMGDRIATFMLYLSHVEEGGHTVFPEMGIFAKPTRGAAVFWYNYSMDGHADPRTLHGGCPVLIGHKWVANKWIHMYGNEMNRKCGKTKAVSDYNVQNF